MAHPPGVDPARINHHLRAVYQTRILVAAVNRLRVLEQLASGPKSLAELRAVLHLAERPAMVLLPALCAMGILRKAGGQFELTELGQFLSLNSEPNLVGYLGLAADDPGVVEMAELLLNDGPRDAAKGIAYTKDKDAPSPMDDPQTARFLTLALAGRAMHLAPLVAAHLPRSPGHLLDVAGGTGYYSYEWLRLNPKATATVFDRPQVLPVAEECLHKFCDSGQTGAREVKSRVRFVGGDMLSDALPRADVLLAFSLFHDWPLETCLHLAQRFAQALNPLGQLWVHDAFLDDSLDGPLAVTDYSSQLFSITKGRCYSRQEHFAWFSQCGLTPSADYQASQMDYSLIHASKQSS